MSYMAMGRYAPYRCQVSGVRCQRNTHKYLEPKTYNLKPVLLLGGSFNPAHAGHLYISREAMKRLGVHETWWLVSPGNPLKEKKDMADFQARYEKARQVARADRRIKVSDFELHLSPRRRPGSTSSKKNVDTGLRRHDTFYTVDTIRALQQRYPDRQFIWLMGADNLAQFHRWKRWLEIAYKIPIVIFTRAPHDMAALHSKAALRFAQNRLNFERYTIGSGKLPKWTYIFSAKSPLSATVLRKTLGKRAFL
ncbi:MAG: nicotinate-nucleotide adenylyltransferase [Rickettsiales bacterium]